MVQLNNTNRWRYAAVHFAISLLLGLALFAIVRYVWYPGDLILVSDGLFLFSILIAVDVVLGPALGTYVFDKKKSNRTLASDLGIIVTLQLSALFYGMWTIQAARPVLIVFEHYRYQVIHATDIIESELLLAPEEFRAISLWGPKLISIRQHTNDSAKFESISKATMLGVSEAAQPNLWQTYESALPELIKEGVPAIKLLSNPLIKDILEEAGMPDAHEVLLFPLRSRDKFFTIAAAKEDGRVLKILAVDGFELLQPFGP
jgi:hypothetical protein